MNRKRVLRIGVRSYTDAKADLRAIADGSARNRDDTTVWVTSLSSLAQLLNEANIHLLEAIKSLQPESVTALAQAVSREPSNVSRTLATMETYGLVEMLDGEGRQKAPRLKFDELEIVYRPRERSGLRAASSSQLKFG
jgi:predicted transcriptional regulator